MTEHWKTWKPSNDTPWNVRRVVHLHRRAGFAATWNEGGLFGESQRLTDLVNGDLKVGVDCRSVYASILENWLRVESAPVVGAEFQPMDDVRFSV